MTSVSQPPSGNFSSTVTARIVTQSSAGEQVRGEVARPRRIAPCGGGSRTRVIAMLESENVTNTLIEYMTTSFETSPRV